MNKCFLQNSEKKLAKIRLIVFEENAPLIPKNDVTEPKARLLSFFGIIGAFISKTTRRICAKIFFRV